MIAVNLEIEDIKSALMALWTIEDEGPLGEGWKSPELIKLIVALQDALETQKES